MTFRSILADYVLGGNLNNNYALSGAITVGTAGGLRMVLDGVHNALLFYDGSNNLVMSLASAAGTDSFGHTFPEGLAVAPDSSPSVRAGLLGGSPFIFFPSGTSGEKNAADFQTTNFGSGSAGWTLFSVGSAQMIAFPDSVAVGLHSNSNDGTTHATELDLDYVDTSGNVHSFLVLTLAGAALTGSATAAAPGTGTGRANIAVPETWHAPALGSGWGTGTADGTGQPIMYRLESNGLVHVVGAVHSTSATPSSTVWTMPAGYVPTVNQRISVVEVAAGSAFANWVGIAKTTGASGFGITTSQSGTDYLLDVYYRLS